MICMLADNEAGFTAHSLRSLFLSREGEDLGAAS